MKSRLLQASTSYLNNRYQKVFYKGSTDRIWSDVTAVGDDTDLIQHLKTKMTSHQNKLRNWFVSNKLTFNPEQTSIYRITTMR